MNIGSIVSTVQSEPLESPLGEEVLPLEEALDLITRSREALEKYEVLVNEEITPEIKEDIFA